MDWHLGEASGVVEEGEEVGRLGGEEDSEGWIKVKEESKGDGEGVMEDEIGGEEDGEELGKLEFGFFFFKKKILIYPTTQLN